LQNKDQFEEIRRNMLADNLTKLNSSEARGKGFLFHCDGTDCPRTIGRDDKQLQAKYSKLIEERSMFTYSLYDGDFTVRGLSFPPTQGGDFYFGYVRSEAGVSIPNCGERKARLPSCGSCYEDLNSNWHMYWIWYPRDLGPDRDGSVGEGLPTEEEILEQIKIATEGCVKAGWEEMGMEIEAN
jgi:hypothetical protein